MKKVCIMISVVVLSAIAASAILIIVKGATSDTSNVRIVAAWLEDPHRSNNTSLGEEFFNMPAEATLAFRDQAASALNELGAVRSLLATIQKDIQASWGSSLAQPSSSVPVMPLL